MEPKNQDKDQTEFLTNREMLKDVYEKTNRMHNVLYGDEKAGIPGVGQRVTTLENNANKQGWMYVIVSAIATGIGFAIAVIKETFKN